MSSAFSAGRSTASQLPKVTVYGDTEDIADKVGVITFNVEGVDAADVAKQLTTWNFAQNILYGLPNSGLVSLYSVFKLDEASDGIFFDAAFGVEGGICSVALLVLACVGLIVYAKNRNLRPHDLWAEDEMAAARQVSGYRAA